MSVPDKGRRIKWKERAETAKRRTEDAGGLLVELLNRLAVLNELYQEAVNQSREGSIELALNVALDLLCEADFPRIRDAAIRADIIGPAHREGDRSDADLMMVETGTVSDLLRRGVA